MSRFKVIGHRKVDCPVCEAKTPEGYCHDCGICVTCETTEEDLEILSRRNDDE